MNPQAQSVNQGRSGASQGGGSLSDQMRQCIQACQDCHASCLQAVFQRLEKGGRHAEPAHIRLLLNCAEICRTSAEFMLHGSPLHTRTCGLCAEICEQCAEDCDQMAEDAAMKSCAEACRSCAASCRRMSGPGASA